MRKKWAIVPYAVSILLLIASFFVSGPMLSIDDRFLIEQTHKAYVEVTIGILLVLWVISMMVIIVLETIGIWSSKPVDRNPLGAFAVLTGMSTVGMSVFEIYYFQYYKVDFFLIWYALFYVIAPIVVMGIYMSKRRTKTVKIVALVVSAITEYVLLMTIKRIMVGVIIGRGGGYSQADYCNRCLNIIPVLCILLAVGIVFYMALVKKNSFRFKWCVLVIVIVVALCAPTVSVLYRQRSRDSMVLNKYSVVGVLKEEKFSLFRYAYGWNKLLIWWA